jgi:hypothetical protein
MILFCSLQLSPDIFPHVAMQRQLDFAERADERCSLGEFLDSEVVLAAANGTCYRQLRFFHETSRRMVVVSRQSSVVSEKPL